MKRIATVIIVFFFAYNAKAQFVSLNRTELANLKLVIERDTAAREFVKPFQRLAERALNEQPNPIEVIASQGLLMGDPAKTESLKAVQDVPKIYSLALCYKLEGDEKYLKKATEFLSAWARVNKPNGNPVNETKLEDAVVAYDLIRQDISVAERKLIDGWLAKMADAEVDHSSAKGNRGTAVNNWNSHRIKVITQIAYTLKNKKYYPVIEKELRKQLYNNLNEDGSTYDFLERDALNYHIFSIEPLLKAIIVLHRATGKNYFAIESEKKGSVKKSVEFLIPFMTGQKKHQEYRNSKVPFDRQRASNNEKGYQVADFIPSKGIVALSVAAYFNPEYVETIKTASPKGSEYQDWQLLLNQVRTSNKNLK